MEKIVAFLILAALACGCCSAAVSAYITVGSFVTWFAGRELVAATTVVTLAVVFFLWYRSLRRVYSGQGLRSLGYIPMGILLFLAYFDATWMALGVVGGLGTWLGTGLATLLRPLVDALQPNLAALVPPMRALNPAYLQALNAVGGLAWKLALVAPIALVVRGLKTAETGPAEPAFVDYFRKQALVDLRDAYTTLARDLTRLAVLCLGGIRSLVWGWHVLATWPIALPLAIGLILPAVEGALILMAVFVLHGFGALVTLALWGAWASTLRVAEQGLVRLRAGVARCPHATCHAAVPLPVFTCPDCNAKHRDLMPGRHGTLSRRCECGRRLPTLFWTGKGRLDAWCPRCDQAMEAPFFIGNYHIPFYGPPGAGKTLLALTTVWRLLDGQVPGTVTTLLQAKMRRLWDQQWLPGLVSGRAPAKTTALTPSALLLKIRKGIGLPFSAYLYDAAGEALSGGAHIRDHRFLRYVDGVVFVVAPESLQPGPQSDALAGQLQSLRNGLAGHGRLDTFPRRIAVVLTHADTPELSDHLEVPPVSMPKDWRRAGRASSAKIEAFVANRQPRMVRVLRDWFPEVRYFVVSTTGVRPRAGQPFAPTRPEAPVCWLLAGRAAVDHPALCRAGWLGVEALVLLVVASPLALGATISLYMVLFLLRPTFAT